MRQIRPVGLQTSDQIEALYQQLHALRDEGCSDLEIDLSFTSFLRPDGILAIVNAARLWHRWTQSRLLLTNLQSDVHKYLERIDLFTVCSKWLITTEVIQEEDRYARSTASRTLLEIMPIGSIMPQLSNDIHRAYDRADAILRSWFPGRDIAIERLCKMLLEIAENIGHSRDHGFVLIQRYDGRIRPHPGSEIVIAVADLGIGIEQSLTSRAVHPPVKVGRAAQGSDYISYALLQGVSSRSEVAGLGLWRVQQIVKDWHGELVIRSTGSMVHVTDNSCITEDELAPVPGTQVTITVRDP